VRLAIVNSSATITFPPAYCGAAGLAKAIYHGKAQLQKRAVAEYLAGLEAEDRSPGELDGGKAFIAAASGPSE
jgi:hypothetical protein